MAFLSSNTARLAAQRPPANGRWWRHVALILAGTARLTAQTPEVADEYQVKAAFIYNFARFVVWPAQAFKTPAAPLSICIVGDDPFHGALEQAITGKTVEGRRLTVRPLPDTESGCNCHILFVSPSGRKRFRSLAENLSATGVLAIGESPGFAAEGGVINFKLEGGRVRFEINVEAAHQQQLHISSKLLSLAQIVKK